MKVKKYARFRYNVWFYFIVFTLVIIAVLWVFQIVLYENLYQQSKRNDLNDFGGKLSEKLNTEEEITGKDINEWFNLAIAASEAGVASYLVSLDESGKTVIDTIYSGYVNSDISNRDDSEVSVDGGVVSSASSGTDKYHASDSSSSAQTHESLSDQKESVIKKAVASYKTATEREYVVRLEDDDGENYLLFCTAVKNDLIDGTLVLVTTELTLKENVRIIQLQLVIVSVVVIIVGLLLSMYISSRISKPLDDMYRTAKRWADGDESVVFAGGTYQEIDELAETLNNAKSGLAQTGILQRDLLANVSHDLKTPLTMIKAYAEMIRDISGDNKARRDEHTQVIIDEADRLTMLVNDILDLSKLQSKMETLDLKRVNISKLLDNVLFRFHDFAENSGYKIVCDIEPDLYTICDDKKIEQVMYNLIGNAINYTGNDKTINVSLTKKNGTILFEAIDSGKGISEDKIQTIWDKYYRSSETHQRPIKGTGLGLNIVKTILDNHKLKYGVISKKDVGSNFFVEFVLAENE